MLFEGGAGHSLKQFLLDLCESKETYTLTTEVESELRQMVTQPPAVHVDIINNTLESVDTLSTANTSTIMQLEDFIDSSFYKSLGLVRRNTVVTIIIWSQQIIQLLYGNVLTEVRP